MESDQNNASPPRKSLYLLKMQPTGDGNTLEPHLIGTIYFAETGNLEIDEGGKESGEEAHETDSQISTYPELSQKEQKHTKYRCNVCLKYFPARGHLQIHMRTHTGEKPYSCYLCGKRSARLHDLQTHILTHSNNKRYGCCYCPSRFNQKSNYTRHLKLHMETSEKKPKEPKKYICDLCQESLPNKNALLVHMCEHEGRKPFECEICEKGFTRQYDLKVHLRIHTGEKPYTCSVCKVNFRQQSNYRRHLKIHVAK